MYRSEFLTKDATSSYSEKVTASLITKTQRGIMELIVRRQYTYKTVSDESGIVRTILQ